MTLYPYIKQISKYCDQRLHLPYQEKENITPEICLVWFDICDSFFWFYFYMNDRHQDQSPYPQCQYRIKWSHGRSIIFNLINSNRIKVYRR